MDFVHIDGSHAEGGGQIIRTALALSALTGKPFKAVNIRKGRKQPGLKAQHLQCIEALRQFCTAETEGAELGSESLVFIPHEFRAKHVSIDIGTAGSITLLLQSLLLPCILNKARSKISIIGGTDVSWSMPVDYLHYVLFPHLAKYAQIDLRIGKRGYYPKGGGSIELSIVSRFSLDSKKKAKPFNVLEQGELVIVKGISHASKDLEQAKVAERQAEAARAALQLQARSIDINAQYAETMSPGSGITLWAVFSSPDEFNPVRIGADVLGERGKPSEEVGKEAAQALLDEMNSSAPVDAHLCDNLIPFLAVFGGEIRTSKITDHTLANIYACEQFFGPFFEIEKEKGIIRVKSPFQK